jgi:transcriptional regulator with XRE-family HTH domain
MTSVISPNIFQDMQLSKNLKKLLAVRDIKASQLARSTQVPFQTIHNWLAGQSPRNFDQVKSIAEYFEVSLDYLLYGTDVKKNDLIEEFKDEINAGVFEVILRRVKK